MRLNANTTSNHMAINDLPLYEKQRKLIIKSLRKQLIYRASYHKAKMNIPQTRINLIILFIDNMPLKKFFFKTFLLNSAPAGTRTRINSLGNRGSIQLNYGDNLEGSP